MSDIFPDYDTAITGLVRCFDFVDATNRACRPLIGGFVVERESWRWTQWTIPFALVAVLAMTESMCETYKKQILKARAKKSGVPGPPEPQRTKKESRFFFVRTTIRRLMHMLFTDTTVTLFDLERLLCSIALCG